MCPTTISGCKQFFNLKRSHILLKCCNFSAMNTTGQCRTTMSASPKCAGWTPKTRSPALLPVWFISVSDHVCNFTPINLFFSVVYYNYKDNVDDRHAILLLDTHDPAHEYMIVDDNSPFKPQTPKPPMCQRSGLTFSQVIYVRQPGEVASLASKQKFNF